MRYLFLHRIHPSFIIILFSIGTIVGIILGFVFELWIFNSPIWLFVSLILLIINFRFPLAATLCLAILAGIIIGSFRISLDIGDRQYVAQFFEQDVKVTGIIYEDPETDGGTTTLRIGNLTFGDEQQSKAVAGSLYVKFYGRKNLERSQKITLSGKLFTGFGSFVGAMYNPKLLETSYPDPPDLALGFRNNFANLVRQFIKEPEVDLSLSYLLGQRRTLPGHLLDALKIVGLTHVIVASGFHLSTLVGLSRKLFKRISRSAALFGGILLIFIFISIAGFTPSMARAGLVSGLSLIAWFFGRKFHPVKLLLIVASVTLFINPFYIQDLGWLLSILSFTGILIVAPISTAYFYGETKPSFVANIVITTMAAQVYCLPLLLFLFGTFSIVSIFANILILPTIPATMLLTFIAGVTSFLPPVAGLIGWLAAKLLAYHIFIVEFFSNLTWALVEIPTNNPWLLLSYVLILLPLIYMQRKTKFRFIDFNMIE
ncbi:ComEC/Rec2 family competence protein [Candidatus Saccharibacteria bacterium]|nr:ComEC/Rec2 family competence protein [Candidatus Saccharibacteria bacterium]